MSAIEAERWALEALAAAQFDSPGPSGSPSSRWAGRACMRGVRVDDLRARFYAVDDAVPFMAESPDRPPACG